jgi:hypothetical protein
MHSIVMEAALIRVVYGGAVDRDGIKSVATPSEPVDLI